MKKYTNSGQFKKGIIPWNKGIKTGISPVNKKDKHQLTCKKCSEIFFVQHYRKESAIFCSHNCKASFSMSGKNHHQWKGGKPKCLDCGGILTQYNAKKCSKHKGMKGNKNPKWIEDRTMLIKSEKISTNKLFNILKNANTSIIGVIEKDYLIINLRTVFKIEDSLLIDIFSNLVF